MWERLPAMGGMQSILFNLTVSDMAYRLVITREYPFSVLSLSNMHIPGEKDFLVFAAFYKIL